MPHKGTFAQYYTLDGSLVNGLEILCLEPQCNAYPHCNSVNTHGKTGAAPNADKSKRKGLAGAPGGGGCGGGDHKLGQGGEERGTRSEMCATDGRRDEICGRPELRTIGLRHAANIPVLEDTTTCPFHYFTDSLLLVCGYAPCRCQELVPELIESQTAVAII